MNITTETKAEAVASGAAVVTGYAAAVVAGKLNIPLDQAAALVGLVAHGAGWLVRKIGKLIPSHAGC